MCVDADPTSHITQSSRARVSPSDSVSSVCACGLLWCECVLCGVCTCLMRARELERRNFLQAGGGRVTGVCLLTSTTNLDYHGRLSKTPRERFCNGAGMVLLISASFASSASSEREHSAELRAPCEMGATRHVSLTRGRQQTARECQSAGPPRAPPLAPAEDSQGRGPQTR